MFFDNSSFIYFIAFLSGLLGGAHCLGMCGGIIIALSSMLPNASRSTVYFYHLCYNLGRIASYSLIGFLAGLLGFIFFDVTDKNVFIIMKVIGGLSLLCVGLHLGGFFSFFYILERFGGFFWSKISNYIKLFIPINSAWRAFLLGLMWGNIPCGLVYATLIWSLSFGSFVKSVILMFTFGLGTLPVMLFSMFSMLYIKSMLQRRETRLFICSVMCFLGVLTIINALMHGQCH